MGTTVAATAADLREQARRIDGDGERAARALQAVGRVWERRLNEGWVPPSGSPFPWQQVRLSLSALIPGLKATDEWLRRLRSEGGAPSEPSLGRPSLAALILAGNTPLLSWSPLSACLLAGAAVFVKMSRGETLWPRLFVQALMEVDPELAGLIRLDTWPGKDERMGDLLRSVDAVVAYGSDRSIASLRAATPRTTPFFGFGHALSLGVALPETCYLSGMADPFSLSDASGFARDVLMFDQGGCLSAQAVFVEGDAANAAEASSVIAAQMPATAEELAVLPVTAPSIARTVREVRDMALFRGAIVTGDADLRWTVITEPAPTIVEPPVGHGVLRVIPIPHLARDVGPLLDTVHGQISCVGVAGKMNTEVRSALRAEDVSRICVAGEMQTPPLDWPNGNRDLLRGLLAVVPVAGDPMSA
jgi:hypothetical protein